MKILLYGKYLAIVLVIWVGLDVILIRSPLKGWYNSLPQPTLGGRQFWNDIAIRNGWRLQSTPLSSTYRLLDANNWRHAVGSYDQVFEVFRQKFSNLSNEDDKQNINDDEGRFSHLVLLMHGLGRSRAAMGKLEKILKRKGYLTLNIEYASTRNRFEENVENIISIIKQQKHVGTISIVGHSYGGLIGRQLLVRRSEWQGKMSIGGLVMIGTPNQGARLGERLSGYQWYKTLLKYGGAAVTLTATGNVQVPHGVRMCIIAGGRGNGTGYNPWLEGDDDGVVRVQETHLKGVKDWVLVKGVHTFLMHQTATVSAILKFLNGKTCRTQQMASG